MNKLFLSLDKNHQNMINSTISKIRNLNLEKEILHQFYEYTLHDLDHFNQVAINAGNLVEIDKLSKEERFCLLGACYCHDLGMAHTDAQQKFEIYDINEIRKKHAMLSRIYIDNELRENIPNEILRNAIGIISEGHGRWDWEKNIFDDIMGEKSNIRIRYLVCILSLADLLDLRNNRKNPNNIRSFKTLLNGSLKSRISIVHWLKHYYSKLPDIRLIDNTIEITLKAEVGSHNLGNNKFHKRASLIQELIQGEVLKVINNKTFKKISQQYFKIKLNESDSKWPCYVQLFESDKEEFPEGFVKDVLYGGFIFPRTLDLDSKADYKSIRLDAFYTVDDLQISFSERPLTILPSQVNKIKKEISQNIYHSNWDIVFWSINSYFSDMDLKFGSIPLEEIVKRTKAIFEALELILSGHLKKVYLKVDTVQETATTTKFISKRAYKFGVDMIGVSELQGGKIDILTKHQQDIFGRYWNKVKDHLGLKGDVNDFVKNITPEYAYHCSIVPMLNIAKKLHLYKNGLKGEAFVKEIDQKIALLEPLADLNNSLLTAIKKEKYSYAELLEADIPVLRVLEIACFNDPWKFNENSTKSLFDINTINIVLKNANKIIGYLFAKYEGDKCHIKKMAIHPFFRRKNLAEKLLFELFKRNQNIDVYSLHVRKSNNGAINLYKKLGFKVVEEIPDHFSKSGLSIDDKTGYYMEKVIKSPLTP